jgi:hypothetical protein
MLPGVDQNAAKNLHLELYVEAQKYAISLTGEVFGGGFGRARQLTISLQSKLVVTQIDRRWLVPQELLLIGPRELRIVPCDDPPLRPDEIRATAILSGISHETELNLYRGTSPFHDKRFDPDLRLFVPASQGIMYPARIGYEWVGRVTEVGGDVSGFAPGDLIHLLQALRFSNKNIGSAPISYRSRGVPESRHGSCPFGPCNRTIKNAILVGERMKPNYYYIN